MPCLRHGILRQGDAQRARQNFQINARKRAVDFIALSCPQCGAPLPRQARWRMVSCTYCGAVVTKSEEVVEAAWFRAAWQRAQAAAAPADRMVRCAGQRYRVLAPLGMGSTAEVLLAERMGAQPQRVVLKLAHADAAPGRLQHEAQILQRLQALQHPGAAYFSQRLPQAVACGKTEGASGHERQALVLRNASGFWGSLEAVRRNYPNGIDPRHATWIWRRVLEVLGFIHEAGWAHGALAPEHLLVHPGDHGILIIGWGDAQPTHPAHGAKRAARNGSAPAHPSPARDLMQAAWTIRALLAGGEGEPAIPAGTPPALADLLRHASEDADWCASLGAHGIDQLLVAAARASFGPPQFIHFTPNPHVSLL